LHAQDILFRTPQRRLLHPNAATEHLRQVSHTEGMFKTIMIAIHVDKFRTSQLFEAAQALHRRCINQTGQYGPESDGTVDFIIGATAVTV
jgi:hypothetical protein